MYTDNYVVKSLELHLFFGRIMKEHSLFLKAGFTPANANFSNKATYYKNQFENLLSQAVMLSRGIVSQNVFCSGEVVTEFTALAEKQTEKFTSIPINKSITQRELSLCNNCGEWVNPSSRVCQVRRLNQMALTLLDGLICFKETILNNVLNCKMFTMNYPLLLEHIIREAKLYYEYICILEEEGCITEENMKDTECFWNQIMMEHAMFIRGLLDPTESDLIDTADEFAKEYAVLLESCNCAQEKAMPTDSLSETIKFRDFKIAGVQGIENCQIRSIILPLLADHVLREANHYIRLLEI